MTTPLVTPINEDQYQDLRQFIADSACERIVTTRTELLGLFKRMDDLEDTVIHLHGELLARGSEL